MIDKQFEDNDENYKWWIIADNDKIPSCVKTQS